MLPNSKHAENLGNRYRDQRDGKESEAALRQHREQGVDRARQHRRRDELL